MTDQPLEQNSKITRFRPDRRAGLVRAVRTLALLGMLACVLFGIWRYQDDLTPENIKRLYLYLRAGGETSGFSDYTFESGLRTVCAPLGSGLAVASGDTYRYVSGLGASQFSIQLKYKNPVLSTCARYALIYDLGNYGLCVANSYAEYLNLTLDSPILAAQMNAEGDFAVVTSERGYRAAVTVFGKRQKQLCKWSTAQYYIRAASVSPEGDRFAALCMAQDGLEDRTHALIFRIGEETPSADIDLGTRRVYALCHDKSGALLILCDDGLTFYDADGAVRGTLTFSTPPDEFSMPEGGRPLLAFDASDSQAQRVRLLAVGQDGETLWDETVSGTLRGLARSGDTALALLGDRLLLRDLGAQDGATRALPQNGARGLLVLADGTPVLIYFDRAQKADMEDPLWT